MNTIIKDMDIPKTCGECNLRDSHVCFAKQDNVFDMERRDKDCPLSSEIQEGFIVIPEGGIGEVSDGFHTFNGLYYQRMMLFAALVKAYKNISWKSHKHEDGELCFGGGWFIVGIDTPEGSYTYHYEEKDWELFECEELPVTKHWDGHTEKDVTRLMSLPEVRPVTLCKDCRHRDPEDRKCDCGELERAGCIFKVDDNYYCAFGEN